jgi:alpha-D-ribose 1-methylphosphonate 5-triphosphate diphosphatase PhnM
MVTACECSVTTPTSGGALCDAGLADEHAANIEAQTKPRINVRWEDEILRSCIVEILHAAWKSFID